MKIGAFSQQEAENFAKKLKPFFVRAKSGTPLELVELSLKKPVQIVSDDVISCFIRSFDDKAKDPEDRFKSLLIVPNLKRPRRQATRQAESNVPLLKLGTDGDKERKREQLRVMHTKQLPPMEASEFSRIHWQRLGHVIHLEGGEGSTGVYLVEIAKKLVILKPGSLQTPGEYFCSLLFERLGMRVPKQRIILSKSDGEFELVKSVLSRTEIPALEEGKLKLKLEIEKASCFTIMEYFQGKSLTALAHANEVNLQRLLNQIGKTITLDILVNNGDRVPFFHRGDGNPGNLLICKHTVYDDLIDICLIDNTIHAILDPTGRDTYLESVTNSSKRVFLGSVPPIKIHGMEAVARFLLLHADVVLDFDASVAVMEGIQAGMKEVAVLCNSTPDIFQKLKDETTQALVRKGETTPILQEGLKMIDPKFLEAIQIRFM